MKEPTLADRATAILAHLNASAKPEPKPEGELTIAAMLAQSRAAHLVYRRSLRHRAGGQVIDGNPAAAAEALAIAARLRATAELADPEHADPAWADDLAQKFPHIALVEFYGTEVTVRVPLAKPIEPDPVFSAFVDANQP